MHLARDEDYASRPLRHVEGFAGWVMERGHALWMGAKARREAKKQMCILETLAIGGKKHLVLVSCGDERFLVGTGADSVQTIVRVRRDGAQDEQLQERGDEERS